MDPHAGQPVATAGQPLAECDAAMIMVHGRGASAEGILDLHRALDRPGFAYLAPAARSNRWYPQSFMADLEANQPDLSSALKMFRHLVDKVVSEGVPLERVLLLGFSQGGCLASEFAVRNPARYGGMAVLSGGLIGPPGTSWDTTGSFQGTPVFFGCSDVDPHVPLERLDESAEVFERMEARVTKRIYPGMGHLVNEDEIRNVQSMMDGALTGGSGA